MPHLNPKVPQARRAIASEGFCGTWPYWMHGVGLLMQSRFPLLLYSLMVDIRT